MKKEFTIIVEIRKDGYWTRVHHPEMLFKDDGRRFMTLKEAQIYGQYLDDKLNGDGIVYGRWVRATVPDIENMTLWYWGQDELEEGWMILYSKMGYGVWVCPRLEVFNTRDEAEVCLFTHKKNWMSDVIGIKRLKSFQMEGEDVQD